MSDTKASPGPWRWQRRSLLGVVELRAANDGIILEVDEPSEPISPDARLIALAPTMASMLESLEYVPIAKPAGWTAGDWLTTSQKACPVCKVIYVPDGSSFATPGLESGHEPDCKLAALLAELRR